MHQAAQTLLKVRLMALVYGGWVVALAGAPAPGGVEARYGSGLPAQA